MWPIQSSCAPVTFGSRSAASTIASCFARLAASIAGAGSAFQSGGSVAVGAAVAVGVACGVAVRIAAKVGVGLDDAGAPPNSEHAMTDTASAEERRTKRLRRTREVSGAKSACPAAFDASPRFDDRAADKHRTGRSLGGKHRFWLAPSFAAIPPAQCSDPIHETMLF